MTATLAQRVEALRDEVLDVSGREPGGPPGMKLFQAVLRRLARRYPADESGDSILEEAMTQRLAWGESEHTILADIDGVCTRLLGAVHRSLQSPDDRRVAIIAVMEVGCSASRMVTLAAVGRAGRERAAQMREERAMSRLRHARERQLEEIARLRREFEGG